MTTDSYALVTDLAASDRDASTDAANPPTLPTPTENTDIDDLHTILIDYRINVDKMKPAQAYEVAKAAITKKLRAERLDEPRLACEYWERNPTLPATYMIDRTEALQAEETS